MGDFHCHLIKIVLLSERQYFSEKRTADLTEKLSKVNKEIILRKDTPKVICNETKPPKGWEGEVGRSF